MIKLVFKQNGETKFLEISSSTYKQLKSHRQKNGVSVQQVVDQVRDTYGGVSEELIIRYLDSTASLW